MEALRKWRKNKRPTGGKARFQKSRIDRIPDGEFGASALAKALCISRETVSNWLKLVENPLPALDRKTVINWLIKTGRYHERPEYT